MPRLGVIRNLYAPSLHQNLCVLFTEAAQISQSRVVHAGLTLFEQKNKLLKEAKHVRDECFAAFEAIEESVKILKPDIDPVIAKNIAVRNAALTKIKVQHDAAKQLDILRHQYCDITGSNHVDSNYWFSIWRPILDLRDQI